MNVDRQAPERALALAWPMAPRGKFSKLPMHAGTAAILAAALSMPADAQTTTPGPVAEQLASVDVMQWMRAVLALSPSLQIDAALRQSLQTMAAEHLVRMEPVVRS